MCNLSAKYMALELGAPLLSQLDISACRDSMDTLARRTASSTAGRLERTVAFARRSGPDGEVGSVGQHVAIERDEIVRHRLASSPR